MDDAEIALKSAGPSGSSYVGAQPPASRGFASVVFADFMLVQPEPADLSDDVRAAKAAMEDPGDRIPYDQFRRQLGLE